jgi:hypothetical protein
MLKVSLNLQHRFSSCSSIHCSHTHEHQSKSNSSWLDGECSKEAARGSEVQDGVQGQNLLMDLAGQAVDHASFSGSKVLLEADATPTPIADDC